MKKRISIFQQTMLVILGIFIAWPVFAVTQVPPDRIVTRIHVYPTTAVIRFTPDFQNSIGCGGSVENSAVFIDDKTMLLTVLSAQLLGKKVGFGLTGSCHPWANGIPRAYRVDIN